MARIPANRGAYNCTYAMSELVFNRSLTPIYACGSGPSATRIPDAFPRSCAVHDDCYGNCGAGRFTCDFDFLLAMISECNLPPSRPGCYALAYGYYQAVRLGGAAPYRKAQTAACAGC
jgi:hypothetical protein